MNTTTERREWARLTATARVKATTLEGLPAATRAYWTARATYTATTERPPFSRERDDPQAIADRRLKAEARRLEERAGLGRIDVFGESIGGDLEVEDMAWVDASGVSHDLPSAVQPSPQQQPKFERARHNKRPEVPAYSKVNWIKWEEQEMGTRAPSEIAKSLGIMRSRVMEAHRRHGIEPAPEAPGWEAAKRGRLRQVMAEVAAAPTPQMEAARAANRSRIDWANEPMGVERGDKMAARLGVSLETVYKAHKRMGIKMMTQRRERTEAKR